MEKIRAVRGNPQLPWLSVDTGSISRINESLDYWINDVSKTETVASMTAHVRWAVGIGPRHRLRLISDEELIIACRLSTPLDAFRGLTAGGAALSPRQFDPSPV